jgi:hypothetical protein
MEVWVYQLLFSNLRQGVRDKVSLVFLLKKSMIASYIMCLVIIEGIGDTDYMKPSIWLKFIFYCLSNITIKLDID